MDRNEQYKHKQETVDGLRERRRQEGNVYVKVERMDDCQHFDEDERRNEEDSDGEWDPEASAAAAWEPGLPEGGKASKERAKCSFPRYKEQRLVEFFADNPAFYDKSNEDYPDQPMKDKLLDELAKELDTTRNQIQGWFKNMRTSVGKLYKSVSSRTNQMLTARKKWQLHNFMFLKPYIVPRTYTVPSTPPEEAVDQSQDEESQHSIPARPASPTSSTPAAAATATSARKIKPPPRKKAKVDHLIMKYLDRSRPEDARRKQMDTIPAPPAPLAPPAPPQPDERAAFCQWMSVRMCGIPYDRWDDFQIAAMRLMHEYSRPGPNQVTSPVTQAKTMPQAQQQWQQLHELPWQQHGGSQSHVPPLLISSVSGSELADLFTKQDDSSEDE